MMRCPSRHPITRERCAFTMDRHSIKGHTDGTITWPIDKRDLKRAGVQRVVEPSNAGIVARRGQIRKVRCER